MSRQSKSSTSAQAAPRGNESRVESTSCTRPKTHRRERAILRVPAGGGGPGPMVFDGGVRAPRRAPAGRGARRTRPAGGRRPPRQGITRFQDVGTHLDNRFLVGHPRRGSAQSHALCTGTDIRSARAQVPLAAFRYIRSNSICAPTLTWRGARRGGPSTSTLGRWPSRMSRWRFPSTPAPISGNSQSARRSIRTAGCLRLYSHKDEAIVRQFENYAKGLGDRYLRDVVDLRAGERWSARLCELIESADVFQLFWSQHSMASAFVRQEWEHALTVPKPDVHPPGLLGAAVSDARGIASRPPRRASVRIRRHCGGRVGDDAVRRLS